MDRSTIYFDDICILCSKSAEIILKNDQAGKFQLASIESKSYSDLLKKLNFDQGKLTDSIVLFHRNKIYTRSSAALRIAANLRFPWFLFAVFYVIPRFLRDLIYDVIARNRYKWFGKRESCFVPKERLHDRFV